MAFKHLWVQVLLKRDIFQPCFLYSNAVFLPSLPSTVKPKLLFFGLSQREEFFQTVVCQFIHITEVQHLSLEGGQNLVMKPLTVTQEPKYLSVLQIWTPLEFLSIPFQVYPLPLKRKELVMTCCILSISHRKAFGTFLFFSQAKQISFSAKLYSCAASSC